MAKRPLFPRRRPRRPSRGERIAGAGVLVLLVGGVGLFFATGAHGRPAGLPEMGGSAMLAASGGGVELPPKSPSGWPRGEVERYDLDTLYEKINGKAEAYLLYDFRALHFASYGRPDAGDAFVDVYVYDMGTPLDAFGMYRSQRRGGEKALPAGDEACVTGEAVFGRRGPHYVEIVASGTDAAGEAVKIAAQVADALPAAGAPVEVPVPFPGNRLRIVRFDRRSALGVEGFLNAWSADYEDGSKLLFADYADAETARKTADEIEETLSFLGEPVHVEVDGSSVRAVVGTEDAVRARELLRALRAGVPTREDR